MGVSRKLVGIMILFHGTTSKFRTAIMRKGLQPRGVTGKNVYAGVERYGKMLESRPDRVYLTDTYPAQFARISVMQLGGSMMVAACKVEPEWLVPDEDFENLHDNGESCLRAHGVVAVCRALVPFKLYAVSKIDYDYIFGDTCNIHSGLKHTALGPRVAEATNYLLMISRQWKRVQDEWVEND